MNHPPAPKVACTMRPSDALLGTCDRMGIDRRHADDIGKMMDQLECRDGLAVLLERGMETLSKQSGGTVSMTDLAEFVLKECRRNPR